MTDVADGCAASGLVVKGDNILSINGTPVTGEVQGRALARAAVGKVEFSILRGNAQVTVIADKPEATTRLGVTFKDLLTRIKDKQYLYAAKPVAVVATAEIEDDFEDVYFQDSPARGRYNQWPALCDCCSAGNCICIYGTCCTLCLAGQMYSNLFETRGKPGCCMNLCLLYTLGSICAYGSICALARAPPGQDPMWITMAQLFGDVVLFVVSVSVCWTLIKASRLAARSFPALFFVSVACVPPGAPTPSTTRARPSTPRRAGASGAAQTLSPLGWGTAERRRLRRLPVLVVLHLLHLHPASALPRLGGQAIQRLLTHGHPRRLSAPPMHHGRPGVAGAV